MSSQSTDGATIVHDLQRRIRETRRAYDRLERGQSAALRRARDATEVALEGVYWRIGGSLAQEARGRDLAHVVIHFPLAKQSNRTDFRFGRFLRREIGKSPSGILRFRRLLDSRDRAELDHRLRGVLRLVARSGRGVDWGVLGLDILWFFAESDAVRRRWSQDFYAPISADAEIEASPNP